MRQRNFLEYRRYLYFKLAVALAALATIAYLWREPLGGHHGNTWLGYTLGGVGAAIILLLLWFGVRKRQYLDASGTLQGWLSAHVYLGTALVIIVTFHTAFEFGWNVHTLCYALMLAVVASGFYGIYAYLRFPRLLTETMGDDTLATLLLRIADIDQQARRVALQLPDEVNALVLVAGQRTRIGGSAWQQLSGRQRRCPTAAAVDRLQQMVGAGGTEAQSNRELYVLMVNRQALVGRARADVMYRARLKIWLYLHVPLALALLAALAAHVLSVFYYW